MTDRAAARGPLDHAVEAAVAGGVDRVQIRQRVAPGTPAPTDAALLEEIDILLASARRGAAARSGTVEVIINRRTDLALVAAADGVHAGFDALSVPALRTLLGPDRLVGVSCHTPDEAVEAMRDGADYVHLAPILAPLSKASTRPPLGFEAIRLAAARGAVVLAQGGLDAATAAEAVRAGASGIAVTGAILGAKDPGMASARLRQQLDAS